MLRHVRGVLRRRDLELTLVEHRPEAPAAFAPISADAPDGPGLAVIAPELSPPELVLIDSMLGEAVPEHVRPNTARAIGVGAFWLAA